MERYATWVEYISILLVFIAGVNLFVYLKTSGLDNLESLFQNVNTSYLLTEVYGEVTLLGIVLGLQIIVLQSKMMPLLYGKVSQVVYQFLWSLIVIALVFVNGIGVHLLYTTLWLNIDFQIAWTNSLQFITTDIFLSFTIYFFMIGVLVSFLRQLRYNFGEAVFYNFLLGKYYQPKEEELSFLFIDLNNSTYIAEVLGHTKYSRFLNQCFNDILEACQSYDFDVYQYVGDEIVLTWSPKTDRNGQAVLMYNQIVDRLTNNEEIYKSKFGIVPIFKASVHTGFVASSLVGKRTKILAYHGDVVNTTARLLELCKKYNKGILFTQKYLESISEMKLFKPEFLINLKLRGKNQSSAVFYAGF